MDPINNLSLASAPALPVRTAASRSAPVLPKPAEPVLPLGNSNAGASPEQQRYEVVLRAAQEIANQFVLGDQRLSTIYKDGTGQYITRFMDLRSGRVTYIPEPDLMALRRRPAEPVVQLSV